MVAADDPVAASEVLLEESRHGVESHPMLRIARDALPVATDQQAMLLDEIASAANRLWPFWYGVGDRAGFKQLATVTAAEVIAYAQRARADLSIGWLRAAIGERLRYRLPVPHGFSDTEHLRQLAMLFGEKPELIIVVSDSATPPERLQALARVCESLAAQTVFHVTLVVPSALAGLTELDSINYAHRRIVEPAANINQSARQFDEPVPTFVSFDGTPHPESPGEQKMAKWLAQDEELFPLFRFNQALTTLRNSRYRVDLLWLAGRLVVEIDGYKTHTTEHQFRMDRQRDYELVLTGFSVLRLTHQEVMQDVALAGEKIRDLVRLQARRMPPAMTQGDR